MSNDVSALRKKHDAGIFTVTVELDPPKSASAANTFAQAKRLRGKVDGINIADCPMANMRMSPIALAHLIQDRENMDTIFHLTCRDRNVMGLQAELLGAAALGVHHILTLTGDDPAVGDHPQAHPVYEVQSEGLLTIARTLNEGYDLNGHLLEVPTQFYIGTTANPGANDLDAEYDKVARRVELGAHFVQTQPIYDIEKAQLFIEKIKPLGVPIMLGLIPLKSYRMAMYLDQKVPGISLTQEILRRMEQGGKEAGLEIAAETMAHIRKIASGVHVMPLNDMDTVLFLLQH